VRDAQPESGRAENQQYWRFARLLVSKGMTNKNAAVTGGFFVCSVQRPKLGSNPSLALEFFSSTYSQIARDLATLHGIAFRET
jgi:hypothetical protein